MAISAGIDSGNLHLGVSSDNVTFINFNKGANARNDIVGAIVPNNHYYRYYSGGSFSAYELR